MDDNAILTLVREHFEDDRRRFEEISVKLDKLLEHRAYSRGAWKTATAVATAIATGASLLVERLFR